MNGRSDDAAQTLMLDLRVLAGVEIVLTSLNRSVSVPEMQDWSESLADILQITTEHAASAHQAAHALRAELENAERRQTSPRN